MFDLNKLKEILHDFNKLGYSDPDAKYIDNGKNGKVLHLEKDGFVYEDEYYGGEPYSGNETIWDGKKPLFRCVYYGKVEKGVNFSDIYGFLKKALSAGLDSNIIHRGPVSFEEGELIYQNDCLGTITDFKLTETILLKGKVVYIAYFFGGLIDQ